MKSFNISAELGKGERLDAFLAKQTKGVQQKSHGLPVHLDQGRDTAAPKGTGREQRQGPYIVRTVKFLFGVDPGVTGAIAYEIEGCTTAVPWNDVSDMYYLLKGVLSQVPSSDEPVAYLEHVTASPIMGKKACFTFGHNFGHECAGLFLYPLTTNHCWHSGLPVWR